MKNLFYHSNVLKLATLIFIIVTTISCKKEKETTGYLYNPNYKTAIIESQQRLREIMATNFIPGLSVSVSANGNIIWSQGMGTANKELNVPATRQTRYRIGSTSQLFTVYIAALLNENGIIDIDESFFEYIPEYPSQNHFFSPRMLGAHTAGFPFTSPRDLNRFDDIKTFRDYIAQIENVQLNYIPDTETDFSDYNIALLALLTEHVTGKFYSNLLNEMILDTLGLKNTLPDNDLMIIPNRSSTYSLDYIARLINSPAINLRPFLPIHGLLSTADDLNILAQQITEPGFFKQETIDLFRNGHELVTGRVIGRSFGWLVSKDNKERSIIAFVGNTIGGSSTVVVYPDEQLVVTICANKGDDIAELPSNLIAQIFLKHIYNENDK